MEANLVVFDELRSEIAIWTEKNKSLVFDYETAKGESDARSHVFKIRQTKALVNKVHKDAKAEALAVCQSIDGERNHLLGEIEKMIAVHMIPINAKAEKDAEAARIARVAANKKAAEDAAAKKAADQKHRMKVEEGIYLDLVTAIEDTDNISPAQAVLDALVFNKIIHVTIIY